MARGVDQVEFVRLAVAARVGHAHGAGLDRDALFALEIHRIEHLGDHLAAIDGAGLLQQAIGQGGLAVVDVGDDGEIADALEWNGAALALARQRPSVVIVIPASIAIRWLVSHRENRPDDRDASGNRPVPCGPSWSPRVSQVPRQRRNKWRRPGSSRTRPCSVSGRRSVRADDHLIERARDEFGHERHGSGCEQDLAEPATEIPIQPTDSLAQDDQQDECLEGGGDRQTDREADVTEAIEQRAYPTIILTAMMITPAMTGVRVSFMA